MCGSFYQTFAFRVIRIVVRWEAGDRQLLPHESVRCVVILESGAVLARPVSHDDMGCHHYRAHTYARPCCRPEASCRPYSHLASIPFSRAVPLLPNGIATGSVCGCQPFTGERCIEGAVSGGYGMVGRSDHGRALSACHGDHHRPNIGGGSDIGARR